MKDILGEPVLVENRAGANQRIALAEVRKSPPDARTLYIGTSGPFSILPNIYGDKLDYDPVKDFTPIARLVPFRPRDRGRPRDPGAKPARADRMAQGQPAESGAMARPAPEPTRIRRRTSGARSPPR